MASQVVLATFPDEAAADAAVVALKAWDKIDDEVKLNAIGVLVLDENGNLKKEKVGSRSIGKGAGAGVILALLTPIGLAAGIVGGVVLGALHHKGLGLSQAEQEKLAADLKDGKAAVGVLANEKTADAVSTKLAELGGDVEAHEVSDEAMAEAATVAAAPEEAPAEAAPEAPAQS
jgi:uncharacterized membrane protein